MKRTSRTILIVEDSATDREIIRHILSKDTEHSYQFLEAETATEVYALCQQQLPDCILLDYHLPDSTGLIILQQLVKSYGLNEIAIVVLSVNSNLKIAVKALTEGAHDFIVKENKIQPEHLLRAVSNAIEKVKLEQMHASMVQVMHESKTHLAALFDQTFVGITEMDVNGYYQLVNDRFCAMTGYSKAELIGNMQFRDLVHPDDMTVAEQTLKTLIADGVPQDVERRCVGKDGAIIWLHNTISIIKDNDGAIKSILSVNADITSRKKAEDKLSEASAFNQMVLENSKDCVMMINPKGQITYMNANGQQLMDVADFDQVKNRRNWCDLALEESHVVSDSIKKALNGETVHFHYFCPTIKGDPKWWDVILSPIYDSSDKVVSLLSVSREITRLKNLELEREYILKSEQDLRLEAQLLNKAKDDFLAILSHELRNPLNSLLGWSVLLKNKMLDEGKAEQAVDVIYRNTQQLTTLIDDILDVSRIISGKLKLERILVDFNRIIKASLESIEPAIARKKIKMTADLGEPRWAKNCDPARLKQMVGNLLTNAIKFTPESGCIHVELLKTSADKAQLKITDTGCGIEADVLPFIFDRFTQANTSATRKYEGLGLGLAIVRSLADLQDCRVWVHSKGDNKGSTFTLEFPLAEVVALPKPDAQVKTKALTKNDPETILEGVKLLLVDDDPRGLEVLTLILERSGAQVTSVNNAQAALEKISGSKPDILLSDIAMDNMDGLDLIQQARALGKTCDDYFPAIAMSGYAGLEDRERAMAAGFQDYLVKPVDIIALPSLILKHLKSS